jgi:hypothetical protein
MWKDWRLRLIADLKYEKGMLRDVWKEVQHLYFKDFREDINSELSKPTMV